MEILEEDLEHVKTVGKGKFGEVSAAMYEGRLVAVKKFFPSINSEEDILWEGEMLWRMTNITQVPNLIGFSHSRSGPQQLVMEFIGNQETGECVSMLSSLQDDRPCLAKLDWVSVMWDVVKGLVGLHRLNLLHCDIKAANILMHWDAVEWRWAGRIVDVGLACRKDPAPSPLRLTAEEQANHLGKCRHLAPEVIRGEAPHSVASDVYAVGTLLCLIDVKIQDRAFKRLGQLCRHNTASKRPTMQYILSKLDDMWGESN